MSQEEKIEELSAFLGNELLATINSWLGENKQKIENIDSISLMFLSLNNCQYQLLKMLDSEKKHEEIIWKRLLDSILIFQELQILIRNSREKTNIQ